MSKNYARSQKIKTIVQTDLIKLKYLLAGVNSDLSF
jgi:hypothetical protein